MEKLCNITTLWHTCTPIFNNALLQIGGKPIHFPLWKNHGISTLEDIFDDNGLCSFQAIRHNFNLENTSFYFYLQLRTALKAHGAPIDRNLSKHPFIKYIETKIKATGLVSHIYQFILTNSYKPLTLDEIWKKDIPELDQDFNWNMVWNNVLLASRNPDHQLIHFNFIHRSYLTPRKLCHMKFLDSPLCTLCTDHSVGTFMHMIWECRPVASFWQRIATTLSKIIEFDFQATPSVFILNDLSNISFPNQCQKRIFLAGITAAKKIIAVRWKPPHKLSIAHWYLTFLDIIYLEISTARMHNAKQENILPWYQAIDTLNAEFGN